MKNNDSINKYNEILESILIQYIFIEDINDILYQAMRKYEEISRHTKNSEDMGKSEDIEKLGSKSAKKSTKKVNRKDFDFEDDICNYTDNEELRDTLREYEYVRKSIKKPILTKGTVTRIFNCLNEYGSTDDEKIAVLQYSIDNGYPGLYNVKKGWQSKNTKKKHSYANMPTLTGKELEDAIEANNDLDMF